MYFCMVKMCTTAGVVPFGGEIEKLFLSISIYLRNTPHPHRRNRYVITSAAPRDISTRNRSTRTSSTLIWLPSTMKHPTQRGIRLSAAIARRASVLSRSLPLWPRPTTTEAVATVRNFAGKAETRVAYLACTCLMPYCCIEENPTATNASRLPN